MDAADPPGSAPRAELDPSRCKARNRAGKQCGRRPSIGKRVCHMHGANGGRPIVHGRRSKLFRSLRERYDEAMADEKLLDMREDIAVLDVVLSEVAQDVEDGAPRQLWSEALKDLREAFSAKNSAARVVALKRLEDRLVGGERRGRALEALAKAAERRSERVEAAWYVKLQAAQAINARDLVAIFERIADTLVEEVGAEKAGKVMNRLDSQVLGGALTLESDGVAARSRIGRR